MRVLAVPNVNAVARWHCDLDTVATTVGARTPSPLAPRVVTVFADHYKRDHGAYLIPLATLMSTALTPNNIGTTLSRFPELPRGFQN